jgi:hypothetical protein
LPSLSLLSLSLPSLSLLPLSLALLFSLHSLCLHSLASALELTLYASVSHSGSVCVSSADTSRSPLGRPGLARIAQSVPQLSL